MLDRLEHRREALPNPEAQIGRAADALAEDVSGKVR